MTAHRMPTAPTVAQLIEALRTMPQHKIVEVCMCADEAHDADEEPTNRDDIYADVDRVECKGDVVVLYCGGSAAPDLVGEDPELRGPNYSRPL